MGKADEGKKKRRRPAGSEGSAKSNKEDIKSPQDVPSTAMQDKSSSLRSKESPLTKKVRTEEQNLSKTPEATEDKQTKVSPMLDSTGSRKKPKSSPGVDDLRLYVESFGGMLEEGWQVDSHRRHGGGKLTKTYISPTNERFRSRVEVAKHLGLASNLLKKSEPHSSNEIAPLQTDNDKEEQVDTATDGHVTLSLRTKKGAKSKHTGAGVSGQRKEHGSNIPDSQEEAVMNMNNSGTVTYAASKGIVDVHKNPAASTVTERCQDALRSIISTENFAALSNILNRGSPSGSIESPLQLKVLPGSIDLQLIHLRLSNGVYGLTPELFSADIKQVWKNISAVGTELVALAQSLLEFSDRLYKQQIMSLFQISSKDFSERKELLHIHAQHGHYPSEEHVISPKDSHILHGNPSGKTAILQINKGSPNHEKKLPTQTYKSKRQPKKGTKSKKPLVFKVKVADNKISGLCNSCGLDQGMDYIMCRLCKASFHTDCTGLPSSKLQEDEWYCASCTITENKSKESASDETTKELPKVTGKTGVCEVCKKEDDNILLCDGCDAAYHMNCILPAIDGVPDESWYCPKCAKNQRSSGNDGHENSSIPDGHNCAVCIRIPKVSPLPNDTEHDAEHDVTEHPSPISGGRPPDEMVEHAALKEVSGTGSPVGIVDDELPEPRFLLGNENACKVCGVESTKSMISCSFCTNRFHLSCLQPPLKRVPRSTWYCPSCLCRVCKIDADDDKILLCDTCDEGYHTYCLSPPVTEKPKGAWFCPACAKPEEVPPNSPSPKQTEVLKRKRKSTEPRRST